MRDDPRAGTQAAKKEGRQPVDETGEQIDGHHARRRDVRSKDICVLERHSIGDAGLERVVARFPHQAGIDLDAEAARAEFLRGGDDDASVAGAQIDHHIVRSGVRKLQHAMHDLVRRGDERRADRLVRRAGIRHRQGQRDGQHALAHGSRRSMAALICGSDQSSAPR
jgi:hypothetical protein